MIFFDNCCSLRRDKQSLSIFRQFGRFFRPPTFIRILTLLIFLSFSLVAHAVQVTLNLKAVPLETAFNEIKKQTGYGFWYEKKDLADLARVTIDVKNADLNAVMEACLRGQPLTYQVFDKTVVVKRKVSLPNVVPAKKVLQDKVRGKVVDAQTKEPLAGVLLKVKAPEMSVVTNDKGEFELTLVAGKYELLIQYLGYNIREVGFTAPTSELLSLELTASENTLEEVKFNAGYYSVKERDRTGSIVRVSSKTIERQTVNNPLLALQGNVAGLQVTQTTGVPGGAVSVQIRGRSSLNAQVGNDPLYVVDGVIYPSSRISSITSNVVNGGGANPLSLINAADIESIEVLKDADATAIYGARGANGVILITTKKGKIGKPVVSASLNRGFSHVAKKLDLMDTEQYVAMRMEAFRNDGLSPGVLDYDVNGVWDRGKYTDWQEVLIGKNARLTNADFNISGGTTSTNYRIGANFYDEGTVFPGDFGFTRGSIHSNLNVGGNEDRFKANLVISYSKTGSRQSTADLTSFITLSPNYPDLLGDNGKPNWYHNNLPLRVNPFGVLTNTINSATDNLVANLSLNYNILDNLIFRTSLGYNILYRDELTKRPLTGLSPANNPTALNRQSYFGNNLNSSLIVEPQLNYQVTFGKAKLDALIGMTFQANDTDFRNILASGFNSDDMMDNMGNASTLTRNSHSTSQYRYAAFFSRINYALQGRYILNITGRRDGSSRFGPNKQFANFGAVGAAWIFSDEAFFKKEISFLSFGKLRASYGLTGNDQIPDYGFMQLWTNTGAGSYQGTPALVISTISNAEYAWEKTKKLELALQLGLFQDRVNIELAYFRNRSSNQLLLNPTPPSLGSSGILQNLPATVENRGLEFQSNFRLLSGKNLDWTIGMNITFPKNELVDYPGLLASSNRLVYTIGQPITIKKVYQTSVNPQNGMYMFEDRDGSGTQNEADRYVNRFIGQRVYGGVNNSFRYKRITFDFLISFARQTGNNYMSGQIYPAGYFVSSGGLFNQPRAVLDGRWQTPGDVADRQKFSTTTANYLAYATGRSDGGVSIGDASFIRLRSLSLGYQFPPKWMSTVKISNAQIVLQAQNLFTFTNYLGLDPESQSIINLPPLRSFSLGLRINF